MLTDTVTNVVLTNIAKNFYPGSLLAESLPAFEYNLCNVKRIQDRVQLAIDSNESSSYTIYALHILLKYHALDLEHMAACLDDFAHSLESKEDVQLYFSNLFHMDIGCRFWHVTTVNDSEPLVDISTMEDLHHTLFELDFYFNCMTSSERKPIMDAAEQFMGKIYGCVWVMPMYIYSNKSRCADCVINGALAYKDLSLPVSEWSPRCYHLCSGDAKDGADTNEYGMMGIFHEQDELHHEEPSKGFTTISNLFSELHVNHGDMTTLDNATKTSEEIDKFYQRLDKLTSVASSVISTNEDEESDHICKKAGYVNTWMRSRQVKIDPKWLDLKDVIEIPMLLADDEATFLYTTPVFGISPKDLIENQRASMEMRLKKLARQKQEVITQQYKRNAEMRYFATSQDPCGTQDKRDSEENEEAILQHIREMNAMVGFNLPQGFGGKRNNGDGDNLRSILRTIYEMDSDQCIQEAEAALEEQHKLSMEQKRERLQKKMYEMEESLASAISPKLASIRPFDMAHLLWRAGTSRELFWEEIGKSNTKDLDLPDSHISDALAKQCMLAFSDFSIGKKTIGIISETIKEMTLGPLYFGLGGQQLPVRAGAILHAVWMAKKGMALTTRLTFKKFSELMETFDMGIRSADCFGAILPELKAMYDKEQMASNISQCNNEISSDRYPIYLFKLRLAVCAVTAFNIAMPKRAIRLMRSDDISNIKASPGQKEWFFLQRGIYVGDFHSKHVLVLDEEEESVQTHSSATLMETDGDSACGHSDELFWDEFFIAAAPVNNPDGHNDKENMKTSKKTHHRLKCYQSHDIFKLLAIFMDNHLSL